MQRGIFTVYKCLAGLLINQLGFKAASEQTNRNRRIFQRMLNVDRLYNEIDQFNTGMPSRIRGGSVIMFSVYYFAWIILMCLIAEAAIFDE